jgi:peptidoglycan/LPS O-acetylase OafA/YrhL
MPASAYVINLSNFGAFGSSTGCNALCPTWALAFEEQFYVVWPVLLMPMLRLWKLLTIACIATVLAAGFLVSRFFLVSGGASLARIYNGPDTQSDQPPLAAPLYSCSRWSGQGFRVHAFLQAGTRWCGPAAGLALVVAVFMLKEPDQPGSWFDFFWTAGPTALGLLAGPVIGSLVLRPAGLASRVLSHPWLANPGRDLSYAADLWHIPIYLLLIPMVPSL